MKTELFENWIMWTDEQETFSSKNNHTVFDRFSLDGREKHMNVKRWKWYERVCVDEIFCYAVDFFFEIIKMETFENE